MDLLRRNRDLRLVFLSQVVSFLGDWFADVALLGLVLDLTNSPVAASFLLVATMLPVFLVTPLAGAAVDAFDRRKLIIAVSAGQTVAALLLLGVGRSTVWLAFGARAVVAALSAFVAPAVQAAIPNLVEGDDLARANALLGSVWGAMLAIGAAVGGAFTVAFGRHASFVADAATFVVAATLIALVRRPMNAVRGDDVRRLRPVEDTVEAFRYASSSRPLLLLLCSKAGLGLAGGVVPLLAVYGKNVFDAGDAGIGLLLAARGAGALLGPFIAQRRLARMDAPAAQNGAILFLCGVGAVVYALGYLGVAASPVLAVALVTAFIAHLGGGAQWTTSNLGLQLATPDALRGRIFAADFALLTLTMSASFLLSGWASDHVGPRPVTVVLAVIAGVWGLLYLSVTRSQRVPRLVGP
jgi:MFS family permease